MTDIFGQFSALDIPAQENNFQSNSQHFISTGDSLTKQRRTLAQISI